MHLPLTLIRRIGLVLGICLCQTGFAGGEESVLEQDLNAAEQKIAEAQAELQTALAAYDQSALPEVGRRLRELKRRRDAIARNLVEVREQRRRNEAAKVVRERPEISRQLELIQPQVREAAAAFAEKPTASRGARLRELSAQEIELRRQLESADATATGTVNQDKAAPGRPGAAGAKPR